jgi:hypothetical protein
LALTLAGIVGKHCSAVLATDILVRDGFLTEEPGGNYAANLITVKEACRRYIEAKSDAPNQECSNAIVVSYFAYLEDVTRNLN